tara:strand:+ start:1935 stop:2114 length:180 start_codon:yes stop_codon:yes gene_type:complete
MDWLLENTVYIFDIIFKVVGIFSVIATMTPNDADNQIADSLFRFVNLLGGNFGKASNSE